VILFVLTNLVLVVKKSHTAFLLKTDNCLLLVYCSTLLFTSNKHITETVMSYLFIVTALKSWMPLVCLVEQWLMRLTIIGVGWRTCNNTA